MERHAALRASDVVELASELCRTPTPDGGEDAVARVVAAYLDSHGFDAELQYVVQDRPNVVAIAPGRPEYKSIMLNGHLDMPPPMGTWRRDPYDPWVEDGTLYGAGLHDMKGGLAALIVGAVNAARASSSRVRRGDIILTAAMHHGTAGLGTKYFLDSCDWRIDAGINGEPTNLCVQVFHGGAWSFKITIDGVARHQSRLGEGANAITAMAHLIASATSDRLAFRADPRHPFLPLLVFGRIDGGIDATMTADQCVAYGDIRFLPSMTVSQMQADLQLLTTEACSPNPNLIGKVVTTSYQRPYTIAPDEWIVQILAAEHLRVAKKKVAVTSGLPAGAYVTDAADMIRRNIPTVIYGPADWRTEPNEGIAVRDLVTASRVYSGVTSRVTTSNRK